jgi:cold shock CspA family protein
MTGTVRTINHEKSFGFIKTPSGDYFFHRSSVRSPDLFEEFTVGTHVEFDPQPSSPKGPRAENVRTVT